MRRGRLRQAGFTLLELLAATALLAIGLVVLANGMGQTSRSHARDEARQRMAQVARSLLVETDLQALRPGSETGLRDGVAWHLRSRLQEQASDIARYQLQLTLRLGDREERFTTLRLRRVAQEGLP